MRQQINLYHPELREQRKDFSATACLIGSGLVVAGLLLVSGFGQWQVHRLDKSVEQLGMRRDAAVRDLADVSQRFPVRQASPLLQAELERVNAALANGHTLATELARMRLGANRGFAAYLEAFARRRVDGLWFTGFRIFNGGRDLELEGSALKPELVTELLQRLAAEETFRGVRFRTLRLERRSAAPLGVDFLLRTVRDEMVAAK